MSALRPAFFILYLESFISRLNVILCHDLTLSVSEPENAAAQTGAAALSGSLTESVRSWHSITFRRLMKDSRFGMKKAGRSADTTSGFFQAQE